MSETGGIRVGEEGKYTKQQVEKYREDYHKSLNLFQKSFQEYMQPNVEEHKKKELQKVMSRALQVMNETARIALKKEKWAEEEKLAANYTDFIADPSAARAQGLAADIDSLKK